jgi:hypothetical protein
MKWTHLVSKKWFFILMVIALVFTCSCRNSFYDDDSVYGSGVVVEEIREVDSFHSVDILGSCDLYFVKGATQELRVITEDNILPLILTWVRYDGTLIIESKGSYTSSVGIKVYVSMVEIRRFAISGSGSIIGESPFSPQELHLMIAGSGSMHMNFRAQKVWSSIVGSGNIHLAGKAEYHNVTIAGSGSLEALDFLVSCYDIQIPGSGECRIHVEDVLNVVIAGSGNVYYKGFPSVVNTTIVGSGDVIHLG